MDDVSTTPPYTSDLRGGGLSSQRGGRGSTPPRGPRKVAGQGVCSRQRPRATGPSFPYTALPGSGKGEILAESRRLSSSTSGPRGGGTCPSRRWVVILWYSNRRISSISPSEEISRRRRCACSAKRRARSGRCPICSPCSSEPPAVHTRRQPDHARLEGAVGGAGRLVQRGHLICWAGRRGLRPGRHPRPRAILGRSRAAAEPRQKRREEEERCRGVAPGTSLNAHRRTALRPAAPPGARPPCRAPRPCNASACRACAPSPARSP
jgi:hypothetical protein